MTILVFAGSLRKESLNKKFAREAARVLKTKGHAVEVIDLRDYAMPVFDQDIQDGEGFSTSVTALGEKVAKATALVIATPEYNGSIPGVLKNVIDWLSRLNPMPLADKHLLLLGASPGALGAVRGLWHTRVPFEATGVHVFPTMMGLSAAGSAFAEDGTLKEERPAKQLDGLLDQFTKHVG